MGLLKKEHTGIYLTGSSAEPLGPLRDVEKVSWNVLENPSRESLEAMRPGIQIQILLQSWYL